MERVTETDGRDCMPLSPSTSKLTPDWETLTEATVSSCVCLDVQKHRESDVVTPDGRVDHGESSPRLFTFDMKPFRTRFIRNECKIGKTRAFHLKETVTEELR